jgi:hypothetical protein
MEVINKASIGVSTLYSHFGVGFMNPKKGKPNATSKRIIIMFPCSFVMLNMVFEWLI